MNEVYAEDPRFAVTNEDLDAQDTVSRIMAEYSVHIMGQQVATGHINSRNDWRRELCDEIDKLYCKYGNWAEIRLVLPPIEN